MKSILSLIALVGLLNFATAQDQLKTSRKAEAKKETCKKSSKCCKEKAASALIKKVEIKK